MIQLSFADRLIAQLCTAMTVLAREQRRSIPHSAEDTIGLEDSERTLSGRLMRVNHAGEMAAQGLYQGQSLLSRSALVRAQLDQAASEEREHLNWCAERISELDMRTSRLDPAWYLGSVAIGVMVSWFGDRVSLGFIAETERQVVKHLDNHLTRLPADDHRSRAIVEQMREDERAHGQAATTAGAVTLPFPIPELMQVSAKIMTTTAYWI